MRKPIALAVAVACICTSAQAQTYYVPVPGEPERVIRLDIEKAIRRALTLPSRLVSPPPPAGVPPPPQAAPSRPPQETRAQWRQRLFDEMKDYCTQYPDDNACGPNALGGGAGR
jgi:hypothetical protein